MKWLLFLIFAYLLGSVPTGLLVAKALGGRDPRTGGSGNLGATNVGRTLGRKAGAITLLGDALKGFVPVAWSLGAFHSPWAVAPIGLAAFAGHLFPLYLRFRGGKGVATGLGVFLALSPAAVLWAALVFAGVVWKWRMVSLGSLTAAAALPLLTAALDQPAAVTVLAVAVALMVAWKHSDNIQRILSGKENRLGGRA